MKTEKYNYKTGRIELRPGAGGIHYHAQYPGGTISGIARTKDEARRKCESFITTGKKPAKAKIEFTEKQLREYAYASSSD